MFDLTKCIEAEKYCKDCGMCFRHTMPDHRFQCYAPLHEYKETNKDKCEFYVGDIRIDPIIENTTCPEDKRKTCKVVGKIITMRK